MDQKDWLLLQTLYKEKNISRTADKMFVSQPSLSYRLKNMEEEFGVNLFYKTKTGIQFTPQGEYLVNYSNEMLYKLQKTKDIINNMDKKVIGTLRIGASSNFAQYLLPKLLKRFSSSYPNVQFHVHTGFSTQIMEFLNTSSVHLGIVRNNYPWQGVKQVIKEERLFIISNKEINIKKLPYYLQINYKTDVSLKETINHWWKDHFNEQPNIGMEVDGLETCKEMVKNEFGFAIVPEICLQGNENLFKSEIKLKDGTPVTRKTWIMFNESTLELSVARHFIEFLQNTKLEQ